MQVLTETLDFHTDQEYRGVSLMSGGEETGLIYKAASGDVEAKLQLVKNHLDLVVELAAGYALGTDRPFSQMVRVGALAVIKAADDFRSPQQMVFTDHVRLEIARAMERLV